MTTDQTAETGTATVDAPAGPVLRVQHTGTPTTGTTSTDESTTSTDTDTETSPTDTAEDESTDKAPNREAQRYRLKLREVEAERDALRARVEGIHRAQAEALATSEGGTPLHKGADLWLDGASLADVLDDAGEVDPAKVTTVREALLTERPYLRRGRFTGSADQGPRGTTGTPRPEPRMGAIFAQGRQ
jgi:hypothetical protein